MTPPPWLVRALVVSASVGLLILLVGLAVGWARRSPRAEVGATVALTLVALGLRLRAPWGPHDLNLRNTNAWVGPRPWSLEYDYREMFRYGHGVEGLAEPVGWVVWALGGAWSPWLLVTWFGLLSAVQVPWVVAVARRLGASAVGAWCAGAWLALHPVALRFARTDVQATPEALWTLTGVGLGLAWAQGGPRWMAAAAGLALGLATHARPDALAVPVLVGVAALLADSSLLRRRGFWLAGVVAVIVALPQVAFQWARIADPSQSMEGVPGWSGGAVHPLVAHGVRHLIGLDPALVGWGGVVGVALALVAPLPAWRVRVAGTGLALALSLLVAGDATWSAVDGDRMGFARHQLRALPFFAIVMGWAVGGAGIRWGRVALVVAATGVVGSVASRSPVAWVPRIGAAEFRFFVAHRQAIEPGCLVYGPAFPYDAGFRPSLALLDERTSRWSTRPSPPPGGCWLYYRSAECSMAVEPPLSPACEAFEAAHTLEPLEEAWLPAGPWIFDRHRVDPVRVGLYRVQPPWTEVPGFRR